MKHSVFDASSGFWFLKNPSVLQDQGIISGAISSFGTPNPLQSPVRYPQDLEYYTTTSQWDV